MWLARHRKHWEAAIPKLVRSPSFLSTAQLSTHTAFTDLPVIDIAALRDPAAGTHAQLQVAHQLDDACRNVGFFYVTNHGVPESVHKGVLEAARAWFALPDAIKQQIAISPSKAYRGFQALGANVTRYDGGFQRDWHQAIDLYKEVSPEERVHFSASPIHGLNQWPHQLPAFKTVLRQYIDEMMGVGAAIMRDWCVRVIHYPPLSKGTFHTSAQGAIDDRAAHALQGAEVERSVQLSCGEHTDYGLLTLVNQESHVAALQVKNAANQWITAHPINNAFVCNIGDMLRVLTNNRYTPTAHRVINADPEHDRVSIPFFYEPRFDAKIVPIKELTQRGGNDVEYDAVVYGRHLERKVLSNFEFQDA